MINLREAFELRRFGELREDIRTADGYDTVAANKDWLLWNAAIATLEPTLRRAEDALNYWVPVDEPVAPAITKLQHFKNVKWEEARNSLNELKQLIGGDDAKGEA